MNPKRKFSVELKRQVVEQLLSGTSSPAQLCRQYEISASLLYHWRRQYSRGWYGKEPTAVGALENRFDFSACETGVGEVKNGEGVYGLGRAFQHAGARTIMMSLWKVPDKETSELMSGFYKNWLSGQTKQEALRQSTLKVLNACRSKYGTAHPLLWGGFVMVGDPN